MQFRWVHINLTTSTIETSMWVNLGNVREIYTFQSSLSSNYGQFMDTFYQIYSEILPNYLPGKISFYNFTSSSPHIAQQRMENGRMPVTINLKNNNKDILLLYIIYCIYWTTQYQIYDIGHVADQAFPFYYQDTSHGQGYSLIKSSKKGGSRKDAKRITKDDCGVVRDRVCGSRVSNQ